MLNHIRKHGEGDGDAPPVPGADDAPPPPANFSAQAGPVAPESQRSEIPGPPDSMRSMAPPDSMRSMASSGPDTGRSSGEESNGKGNFGQAHAEGNGWQAISEEADEGDGNGVEDDDGGNDVPPVGLDVGDLEQSGVEQEDEHKPEPFAGSGAPAELHAETSFTHIGIGVVANAPVLASDPPAPDIQAESAPLPSPGDLDLQAQSFAQQAPEDLDLQAQSFAKQEPEDASQLQATDSFVAQPAAEPRREMSESRDPSRLGSKDAHASFAPGVTSRPTSPTDEELAFGDLPELSRSASKRSKTSSKSLSRRPSKCVFGPDGEGMIKPATPSPESPRSPALPGSQDGVFWREEEIIDTVNVPYEPSPASPYSVPIDSIPTLGDEGAEPVVVARRSKLQQEMRSILAEWAGEGVTGDAFISQDATPFGAERLLPLVRLVARRHEELKPPPPRRTWRRLVSCDCLVWAALLVCLLLSALLVAGALARELRAEDTGVLLAASSDVPAAGASLVRLHGFQELQGLPPATLRRIRDCTFVHRSAFHRIRVGSLVRDESGVVHLTGHDGSSIRVEGSRAVFARPFHGDEELDLEDHPPIGAGDGSSDPHLARGCSFTVMASAPERAQQ